MRNNNIFNFKKLIIIMKLEELIAKCPKCGSTDKTAKRLIYGEQRSHAKLKEIVCDNCGYVFEKGDF